MTTTLLSPKDSVDNLVKKQLGYFIVPEQQNNYQDFIQQTLENFPAIFDDTFARPVGFTYMAGGPVLIIELPPVRDRATFIELRPSRRTTMEKYPPPIKKALNLPYPWLYLMIQVSFPNAHRPDTPQRLYAKLGNIVHSYNRLVELDGTFNPLGVPIGSYLPNHRAQTPPRGVYATFSAACTNYNINVLVDKKDMPLRLQNAVFDVLSNYLTAPYNTDYFYYGTSSLAFAMILRSLKLDPSKMKSESMQTIVKLANERLRVAENIRKIIRLGTHFAYPLNDVCKDYIYILQQLEKNPDVWENPDLLKLMKLKQNPISPNDVFYHISEYGAFYKTI